MILSPALMRWGPPTRHGLCSHLAHLWATSDFVPRSAGFGSTKGGGSPSLPFGGGCPPPPYSPPNCQTPLGVTHRLAAVPPVAPQVPPPKNRDQLPMWHSVYFRNEFNCSYYNMKMIRRGVLTWGHFQSLEDVRLLNALPRTWKGVYNHGGRLVNKIPSKGGFHTPTVHVQNWTRAWLLQFYASQPGVRDPQTPQVWEQWANAQLPPRVKDFAQRVLWHKLTVHERVYKRSGTDKCPICSQKESIKHAMVECSMFKAAAAVIQHYYGPVEAGDGKSPVRDMMESDQQEWLLSTDQGWAIWSARSAH